MVTTRLTESETGMYTRSHHRQTEMQMVSCTPKGSLCPTIAGTGTVWPRPWVRRTAGHTTLPARLTCDTPNNPNGSQLGCPCQTRACGRPAISTDLSSVQGAVKTVKSPCWAHGDGARGDRATRQTMPHGVPGGKAERGLKSNLCPPCSARCPGLGHTCPQQDASFPNLHREPRHH